MSTGLLLALGYALGWLPMFLLRVEAVGEGMRTYPREERIGIVLAPLVLSAHVTLACLWMSLGAPPSLAAAALGAACFAAALAFWLWGRRQIGPLRQLRPPAAAPLVFRREGAFGIVRHPLYAAFLLAAAAPLPLVGARLLPGLAACVGVLALRAVQEERHLRRHLGAAYDDYCRRVRRLIPFVW